MPRVHRDWPVAYPVSLSVPSHQPHRCLVACIDRMRRRMIERRLLVLFDAGIQIVWWVIHAGCVLLIASLPNELHDTLTCAWRAHGGSGAHAHGGGDTTTGVHGCYTRRTLLLGMLLVGAACTYYLVRCSDPGVVRGSSAALGAATFRRLRTRMRKAGGSSNSVGDGSRSSSISSSSSESGGENSSHAEEDAEVRSCLTSPIPCFHAMWLLLSSSSPSSSLLLLSPYYPYAY